LDLKSPNVRSSAMFTLAWLLLTEQTEAPNALAGKLQHLVLSVAPFRLGALCKYGRPQPGMPEMSPARVLQLEKQEQKTMK